MTHRKLIVAIVILTVGRLWIAGQTELLPEEAYYWIYAKHPALSYFDHPPMVAWMIAAGTALLGDTERGVRLMNTLLWIGSCLALVRTARLWFDERVALWSGLLYGLLPVFVAVGFIVTPDGPLVFFWTLTLYALTQALRTSRTRYWLLAGVTFGGALLSKYYAVILAPSLLAFLLMSPKYRHWLGRWQPWVAIAIAIAAFSPVILWNQQHQWASFAFQSARTVAQKGSWPVRVGTFWMMQFGVLTPMGLALYAAAAVRGVKSGWLAHDDAWNFAVSFSLPLFLLFVAAGFKTEVHVNWTAPAFLALTPAGVALFLEHSHQRWWRAGAWTFGVICVAVTVLLHSSLAYGEPKLLAYTHAGGWRMLAARVENARRDLALQTGQQPFVIGADRYNIAAELGFYLRDPHDCVNMLALGGKGLGYRYWMDLHALEGRPAVTVMFSQKNRALEELPVHFERVDEPVTIPVGSQRAKRQEVTLVNCYGYREASP